MKKGKGVSLNFMIGGWIFISILIPNRHVGKQILAWTSLAELHMFAVGWWRGRRMPESGENCPSIEYSSAAGAQSNLRTDPSKKLIHSFRVKVVHLAIFAFQF